jgi:hypothetical protein
MADNAVRYVKLLALGDHFGIAAVVVVSCILELLDSRRFDLAGLEFERCALLVAWPATFV